MNNDITIVYYTSNYLETTNPVFLKNTQDQLIKAADGIPIIIVSQKPMMFGPNSTNIVVGDIGRSHLNLYRQILIGTKAAKTKYVAMAEDDILYSWEHFHSFVPINDVFLYDMNKLSIFTWIKPALYSFRHDRMVVNQLIAKKDMLVEALQERFAKFPDESKIDLRVWGDPGRYENQLGVTTRPTKTFMCTNPSIVFTHENAFGYLNHGKRKKLGDLRIIEVPKWGRAEEVLRLYYEPAKTIVG